jgi:hypothetical protein
MSSMATKLFNTAEVESSDAQALVAVKSLRHPPLFPPPLPPSTNFTCSVVPAEP